MSVSAARDSTPPPLSSSAPSPPIDLRPACLPTASWLAGRGQFVEAIPNTCCQEWIDFSVSFFAPQMGLTHCWREPLDGRSSGSPVGRGGGGVKRHEIWTPFDGISLSLSSPLCLRPPPGQTTAGPDRTTRLSAALHPFRLFRKRRRIQSGRRTRTVVVDRNVDCQI